MSEPEIARRCSHCGISLRQRAMFCPQCGQKTGESEIPDLRDTQVLETQLRETQVPETQIPENSSPLEKIKHVSSVMIDQAAYDPSLRFLLVAAAIFVVFVVVVILSKVIG
jgi:uncharacterized Zn finger protein (UPF0148 family)